VSHAQDNTAVPAVVDLPAVLKLVREVSPRLSIERQGVAGAEASRITAGAYPNPTINYGRYRPSAGGATLFDGTRQEQTIVELPLLIAGQRGARVEKAERDIEAGSRARHLRREFARRRGRQRVRCVARGAGESGAARHH
jgi:cobalt-zinc-cadmium efflux system outer membrane protein